MPGKFALLVSCVATATLKEKGRMSKLSIRNNAEQRLANYLRAHRRRIGLSQFDLGAVLGYRDEGPVSRHELLHTTPPLVIALGYEIVYRVPVSEIFAGLKDEVEGRIENRLAELETRLQQRSANERSALAVARKLEWLALRRDSEYV